MEDFSFRSRSVFLLILLLLWGAVSIFQLYKHCIRNREKTLSECRNFAWKEALLPGKRGAILDKNGRILVQNQLQYSLLLTHLPAAASGRKRLERKLRKDFPFFQKLPSPKALPLILKEALTADEIQRYTGKYHFWREVTIRSRMKRHLLYPSLGGLIGQTAFNDQGEMVGISGLEKEFDTRLSGRSGRCQVMLDRFGNWLPESLRILREPHHGQDVRADFALEEKLAKREGEAL